MAGKNKTTAPVATATDNAAKTASNNTDIVTIDAKIVGIRLRTNEETGEQKYRLILDKTFDGVVYNRATKDYEEQVIDYKDYLPFVFIAQVLPLVKNLDFFYAKKKESSGCGTAELDYLLKGSDITIVRTHFDVGTEYTTSEGVIKAHEHAGWNTEIKGITVTKDSAAFLQRFVDKVMFDF